MRLRLSRSIVFIVISLATPVYAQSPTPHMTPAEEFRIKKEVSRERIIDFYQRIREQEKIEAERRRGIEEARKRRKIAQKKQESSRKIFIEKAVRPAPLDPAEWEREVKKKKAEYERSRRDYARRKAELDKLLQGVWKIPEEEEYDLIMPSQEANVE